MFSKLTLSVMSAVLFVGFGFIPTQSQAQTVDWTNASGNNLWSQGYDAQTIDDPYDDIPSNWTTNTPPNSAAVDVNIGFGTPYVNHGYNVGTIDIASGATLGILTASDLAIHAGSINNNGTISLEDIGSYSAFLTFHAPTTLTGTGQILFNSHDDNILQSLNVAAILTIGSQHLLTTSATTTFDSQLRAAIINHGTIEANGGRLVLNTFDKSNDGAIQAINGGYLLIDALTLDNTNGYLYSRGTSTVELKNTTVIGGTFSDSGLFNIASGTTTFDGSGAEAVTIDSGSTITLYGTDTLQLVGTINNNGTIKLHDTGGYSATLKIMGQVSLEGSGQVLFSSNDDNVITGATADDVLTVGANQTLTTTAATVVSNNSLIFANVVNNGIIEAKEGKLELKGFDKTNHNMIRATDGGYMHINNITIHNDLATITSGADSSVILDSATIEGGTLNGSGLFNVTGTTKLDGSGTEAVTIASGSTITLFGTDALQLVGTINNNGTIKLHDVGGYAATLQIMGQVSLEGTGQVLFSSHDDNLITGDSIDDVLTVGANQMLTTSDVAVQPDNSQILAAVINNGIIEANVGGLELKGFDKTNHNIIRAINQGALRLNGITLHNNAATLTAETDSTVHLYNATIEGGTLNGDGLFQIYASATLDGTTDGPVTLESTIVVDSAETLNLQGTIVNNGTIKLHDLGGYSAYLKVLGQVSLNGTGQVLFSSHDDNAIIGTTEADVLTVGADQKLTTSNLAVQPNNSQIHAAVINNGIIEANVGGLELKGFDKTNQNIIRATNQGSLRITDITLHNNAATLTADTDSTVHLYNATIEGGTLNGDGLFQIYSSATLDGATDGPLTLESTIVIDSTETLNLQGTIINNGTIKLHDLGSYSAYLKIMGQVSLEGSGQVLFSSHDDNVITGDSDTDVLTIGASQKLTTSAVSVQPGNSQILAAVINNGLIEANAGGLELKGFDKTNSNIIRATNGGQMSITGGAEKIIIHNQNANITSEAGSTIHLNGATIIGGTIDGGGVFQVGTSDAVLDGQTSGALTINNTTVLAQTYRDLTLKGQIINNGTIEINEYSYGWATLYIDGNGSPLTLEGNGQIRFGTADDENQIVAANEGDSLVIGQNQSLIVQATGYSGGYLRLDTVNQGTIQVDRTLWVTDASLTNATTGLIKGNGEIEMQGSASFTNNGTIAPGNSAGSLLIDGDYTQQANGVLQIELGGSEAGEFDVLNITKHASLAGTLQVDLIDDFEPMAGQQFTILTANTNDVIETTFDHLVLADLSDNFAWMVIYNDDSVMLEVGVLGDVNGDGVVNGFDVDPFVDVLLNGPFNPLADMNSDGAVNGFDVDPFVAAVLGGNTSPLPTEVPEPMTLSLLAFGSLAMLRRKK